MRIAAPHSPPNLETIRAALDHIPPDEGGHDQRVRIAFAVFDGIGDAGGELFLAWAARRSKPDAAGDRATWRSAMKPGPVKVGTLFGIAKGHGFTFDAASVAHKPTQAELKAQAEARRVAAEREEAERMERQHAGAIEAARLWESAADLTDPSEAPYLVRKGVKPYGVRRLADGTLCVPLRDADLKLWNLQTIAPLAPADGGPEKRFLRGARKSGLWHWIIGDPRDFKLFLIAEGYATGASIHEATGRTVAVALDAGNLAHVVRALRGRWPAARLIVCGDDDAATKERTGKNAGRDKATEAARLGRGVAVFPDNPDGGNVDFNDWCQSAGLAAVRERIEAAIAEAQAAERAAKDTQGTRGRGSANPGRKGAPPARERPARGDAADDDEADEGAAAGDAFECNEAGVWRYLPPSRDGGGGGWRRVCDPLHVEALARDQTDGAASLVIRFESLFGQERRVILPLASLAGEGGAWRGTLADAGFAVPPDTHRRRWLAEYLAGCRPGRLARLTERTGWHGRAFVLPGETIGGGDEEPVLFVGERIAEGGAAVRSDLDKWRLLIGRHCVGQSRLMFAVSAALAGPCVAWAGGIDSGGVHFVGDSSTGKTTALRVAASVYGPPGFMQRWRGTDNGIEGVAAAHSDLCLCLDELAQLDPKAAGEAAYMLGNGAGKVRAGRSGGTRPRLSWRLLFLSAGEVGLSDHMAEANKRSRAGQELRLIDVPADAGKGFGVFDQRGAFDDAGGLARHLADACARAYGSLGRAWLEHLTGCTDTLPRELRERMGAFEAQAVPEAASGQVARVGRRFALIAAAGELATAAGLTGWESGQAQAATLRVFNAWVEGRPAGIGASEEASMMRQVRGWFEAHGEARLTNWDRAEDDHRPQTMHRAGWRRAIETEHGMVEVEAVEWLVLPELFRTEIAKGWNDRAVLRLLAQRGHLMRERGSEYACRVRVPGLGKVQVYRIRSTLFDEAGD